MPLERVCSPSGAVLRLRAIETTRSRRTAEVSAELIDKAYRLRLLEVHPDLAGVTRTD